MNFWESPVINWLFTIAAVFASFALIERNIFDKHKAAINSYKRNEIEKLDSCAMADMRTSQFLEYHKKIQELQEKIDKLDGNEQPARFIICKAFPFFTIIDFSLDKIPTILPGTNVSTIRPAVWVLMFFAFYIGVLALTNIYMDRKKTMAKPGFFSFRLATLLRKTSSDKA